MNPDKKATILIVDDEAANLGVLYECLQQTGYKVFITKTAADTLRQVDRIRPDLILLDIMLPDMDGFELCRRLKKNQQISDTLIIFLSALTDTVDKLKGLDLGAVDYITKPFDPAEVVARVDKHLTIKTLQLQLETQNRQLEQEIAERKQTEKSIRKLSRVVEQTADIVMITNTQGIIEYVNPAFEALTGYAAPEVLGQTPRLLKSDQHEPEFYKNMWQTVLAGQVYQQIVKNKKQDGTFFYEEKTITPLLDEYGNITHFVSTGKDITERHRIAIELEHYANQNIRLLKEEQRQRKIVESLRQAMLAFSMSLDHTAVLAEILARLKTIIPYNSVGLFLQEEDNLRLVSGIGLKPDVIDTLISLNGNNPTVEIFKRRQAEIISDVRAHPHWQIFPAGEQIRSSMAAPLLIGPETIGVLTLDRFEPNTFTQEDINIFLAFANQAAIVIKNTELYKQAQHAAALEERNRLAQDLHDAVNQTLFTASIMAEAVPKAWETNPEQGRRGLEEVRRLTQEALAEMRTLLLELRPQDIVEKPLGRLLSHLTRTVTGRSRIPIELSIDHDNILPPDQQIAFYRIAQESLNNIVKHAQATQTRVYLNCHPRQARLQIQDNGRGFDLNIPLSGHFGLKIMQERAAKIGATLTITSHPEQGTAVELVWPGDEE
ncbi:MAG: response regulator [Chloroflexi bacterium]|nr:response regulator [Chloroflexota bacterium]